MTKKIRISIKPLNVSFDYFSKVTGREPCIITKYNYPGIWKGIPFAKYYDGKKVDGGEVSYYVQGSNFRAEINPLDPNGSTLNSRQKENIARSVVAEVYEYKINTLCNLYHRQNKSIVNIEPLDNGYKMNLLEFPEVEVIVSMIAENKAGVLLPNGEYYIYFGGDGTALDAAENEILNFFFSLYSLVE